jgi:hypothetical protein
LSANSEDIAVEEKIAPHRPFSSARIQSINVPNLEDSSAVNLDFTDGPVARSSLDAAKLVNDIFALHDLAEDGVFAVEVRSGTKGDEELRTYFESVYCLGCYVSLHPSATHRSCQDQSLPC